MELKLTGRISDCNNSANQRWTLVKGSTSVKLAGSNYCLDAGGSPGNGAQAKVYTVSLASWEAMGADG
jgi:hypothetical protein